MSTSPWRQILVSEVDVAWSANHLPERSAVPYTEEQTRGRGSGGPPLSERTTPVCQLHDRRNLPGSPVETALSVTILADGKEIHN